MGKLRISPTKRTGSISMISDEPLQRPRASVLQENRVMAYFLDPMRQNDAPTWVMRRPGVAFQGKASPMLAGSAVATSREGRWQKQSMISNLLVRRSTLNVRA